ncbi:MAG: KAP family NTPase [bacterium]|nr:KAP family NTPase [bacterium]
MSDKKNHLDAPLENPEKNYSDSPQEDLKNDELNFAPYAKTLAKAITNVSLNNGAVMAIYGEWGSGKSTLINFILKYLQPNIDNTQKPEIMVIKFNPWLFSGQENLVGHFFEQIRAEFALTKNNQWGSQLLDSFEKLSDVLSPALPPLEIVTRALRGIKNTANPPKSINRIHTEIKGLLRGQDKRFLIVIDDIDRLTRDEIRQLFGLVKSVANFPNILYLLAFDKEIVSKAISPDGYGDDFLEKIVQFPFEMPLISQNALDNLLISSLEKILNKSIPETFYDKSGYEGYYVYLRNLITTPRDIVRFLNTFEFTYSGVKGEVHEGDFIAIEMLRMFNPRIYEAIKNDKDYFTRPRFSNDDLTKELLNSENPATRNKLAKFLSDFLPNSFGSEYRLNLRLGSLENFDVYFCYSSNQISKKVNELYKALNEGLNPTIRLFESMITKNIHIFEDILIYLTKTRQIPYNHHEVFLQSLFEIAPLAFQHETNRTYIGYWISDVIENILLIYYPDDKLAQYNLIKSVLGNSKSPYLSVLVMDRIIKMDGANDRLRPHQIEELKSIVIPQIHILCNSNISFDDIKFRDTIEVWIEIQSNDAKKWLWDKLEDYHLFLQFIKGYITQSGDNGYDIPLGNRLYYYFENKERFVKKIKDISLYKDLSDNEKLLCDQVLHWIR